MSSRTTVLHCSGCHRAFGYGVPRSEVFCSEECAISPSTGKNEERDDLIVELANKNHTLSDIGRRFGISRQRVFQIVETHSEAHS